ncbi:MAG: methyltransferase [Rhodoferax sp.]|nr:methyltransferase [Rhodoferax sp.]
MTDWTAGYVADIGYTFGYYTELNPLRLKLAFLNRGLVPPAVGAACELGFGQGLSANVHAAASVTTWHGTDFNPAQAGFARELASASGAQAFLFDESFAEFAARTDLPEFDFIGLHGIWSWISDENRRLIVEFVRRRLKVGGVLYVSYNTLPGWGAFAPMRHLLTQHAEVVGASGRGIVSRIDEALDFTDRLLALNPLVARANPQVVERMRSLRGQNRQYLAHEYFNRDWHPMHFATMAEWLEPAKVQYGCSAHYLDHIDVVNLTPEQRQFLDEVPDPMFRETVRDFMVNQQFRRDYWVKGARRLSPLAQAEALRAVRVMLTTPRSEVSLKVTGALGEASLNAGAYEPVLELLADHGVRTLAEIERALRVRGLTPAMVLEVAMVLVAAGHLALVQDDAVVAQAAATCRRLNAALLDRSRGSADVSYLASPVVGGGVPVGRVAQWFLRALAQGKTTPQEWAASAWEVLSAQNQKLVKDGQTLESAQENLAELGVQAAAFAAGQWPALKALQVV